MKRIFACILIVLLLSALLGACDMTDTPNDNDPVVPVTPNVSPSPADGNNLPNIPGDTEGGDNVTRRAGIGNNNNAGNNRTTGTTGSRDTGRTTDRNANGNNARNPINNNVNNNRSR